MAKITEDKNSAPEIDIIIPHYNGSDMLRTCLNSLRRSAGVNFRIILVDNGSSDGSPEMVEQEFPEIMLIKNKKNLGYAGGCNKGYEHSTAPYIFFYNNDTEIDPKSLKTIVEFMNSHPEVASVQPKILSMRYKGKFDYAGAAGGFIDRLGFPWCRGRVIDAIEEDKGQYDEPIEVFWTSGAAVVYRKEVLDKVGVFDLKFFAHMEEIDLNWRAINAGYRHYNLPQAVVYHYSGYTLGQGNKQKLFFNHRNNLLMILKNAPNRTILWLYPVRLLMDLLMAVKAVFSREFDWARGIVKAFFAHFLLWPHVVGERYRQRGVIRKRIMPRELVFPVSIIFDYFILKKRKFSLIWNRRGE
jgi:GT2 family glycosyltransferase